ncbi:MAG: hypothetical protein [Microvirus sp.]|nr:MAG: hypothetical protein [Microvirus sp.]
MCGKCNDGIVDRLSPAQLESWAKYEVVLMKRHKIAQGKSKRSFSRNADRTHKKNMPKRIPMRGGIRL